MVVNKGQWKDQLHLLNDFVNTQRKFVFEDEKDFPPQIPTNQQNNRVYFSGSKNDINNNRLFHESNKFTKKSTDKCCCQLEWHFKTIFVG